MSAIPLLNSNILNKKSNDTKNECDKYLEIFKDISIENKYKLMYNMSTQELQTFKQCEIKWLTNREKK